MNVTINAVNFEMADKLSKISGVAVPDAVSSIRDAKIIHDSVCSVSEMKEAVKGFVR